jgi:hypothetical protein
MTTPSERTRVLLQAGELLRELRTGQLTIEEAQRQALVVLRHYPDAYAIGLLALRDNTQPRSMLEQIDKRE